MSDPVDIEEKRLLRSIMLAKRKLEEQDKVWACNVCGGRDFRLRKGGLIFCSGSSCTSLQAIEHFDPRIPPSDRG